MHIKEGTTHYWRTLASSDYSSHKIAGPRKTFNPKLGEELCGIIVYSYPPPIEPNSKPYSRRFHQKHPETLNFR